MLSPQTAEQLSDLKAIGFALAGFTFWVLTDTSIKLVGQSGLPPYEMVAFLGLFMAVFLAMYGFARGQPVFCAALTGSAARLSAPAST
jgi:hypothetical protein